MTMSSLDIRPAVATDADVLWPLVRAFAVSSGAAYVSLASRRAGDFYIALGYDDSAVFFKKSL